ncbi:hypothetical protein QQZ08_001606 [Neonectria magnoliae]|uniref:cellulase n=1 Tax=Neonectria magnoliae TaxID=2732573 RepID=A0ABR1IGQ7_9HYPO
MRTVTPLLTGLALASGTFARVKYLGVAIPGIDLGCDIDGSCPLDTVELPLTEFGGGDGAGQMKHFVEDDGFNVFRLPTSWQYIVNHKLGADLDETNFGNYDKLMQACLDTGAYCMIDVHNFARWDDGIIGQGDVSDDDFVRLWVQLAQKYGKNNKVIFGLMNEPHDLDIKLWGQTCQKVVTAVRKAGAKSNMILLPGTNFASAETFVSSGSAEALGAVSNPDGSKDNLYMDLHKYLDENNSGTFSECTTDNVEGFTTIATWLRKNKRQAMISESGASLDDSCMEKFCTQNEFIAKNSDVFVGFVGWGAGSFKSDYILTLTPEWIDGSYVDNKLMKECIIKPFIKNAPPETTTSSSSKASRTKAPHSKTSDSESSTTEVVTTSTKRVFKEETEATVPHASATEPPTSNASSSDEDEDEDSGSAQSRPAFAGGLILAGLALFHTGMRLL